MEGDNGRNLYNGKMEEIFTMEKITHFVRLKSALFEKRWKKWILYKTQV